MGTGGSRKFRSLRFHQTSYNAHVNYTSFPLNQELEDFRSFRTHMQDLQEVTHEIHYENYRSEKLQPRKQLRSNDLDADEQQKKLIKEKDDEVTNRFPQ